MRSHLACSGGSRTPLYRAWEAMNERTRAPFQRSHPSYLGVRRDPRWSTFEGFVANPPSGDFAPGKVLARSRDIGDYSPDNCRWATRGENAREANENRMIRLADGRFAADVARENGVDYYRWHSRIREGWTVERAVSQPIRRIKR